MKRQNYVSRLAQLTGINRLLILISATSVVANLLLVFWVLGMDTREKVIITPPTLEQAFWVHGDEVAPEYLTQMADWFTGLATTYTPHNARARSERLLSYVHPAKHGALAVRLEQRLADIARYRESSTFHVREILVKGLDVVLFGDQRRMLGERSVENRETAYRVEFRYQRGRLSVWDLVEVDRNAPFDRVAAAGSH